MFLVLCLKRFLKRLCVSLTSFPNDTVFFEYLLISLIWQIAPRIRLPKEPPTKIQWQISKSRAKNYCKNQRSPTCFVVVMLLVVPKKNLLLKCCFTIHSPCFTGKPTSGGRSASGNCTRPRFRPSGSIESFGFGGKWTEVRIPMVIGPMRFFTYLSRAY